MFHFPETNFKIKYLYFACIMAVAVIISLAADPCRAQVLYKGKVNVPKLNIRSQPSIKSSVIVVLNKGERVDVLGMENNGEWLKIEYQDLKGYIKYNNRYILLKPVSSHPKQTQNPARPNQVLPKPALSNQTRPKPLRSPPVKLPGRYLKKKPANLKAIRANRSGQKGISKQLQEKSRKVKEFTRQEMQVIDELNDIDQALNRARVTARGLKREELDISREIKKTQERIAALNKTMAVTQDYAGERLNALFHMHMMGRLEMAGPPSSLFDFTITQNALKKVMTADFALLEKQVRDMKELNDLKQDLNNQHKLKSDLQAKLADEIEVRKKEALKKEEILKDIRRNKRLTLASINALEKSSRTLNQTISAIGPAAGSSGVKTSFVKQKGRLQPPVEGKIISNFGTKRKGDYNAFTFQSGIDIKAERGAPVKNVFNGEVMFAQWLKGYGNLMIISHGNNYYTLYAHVEELFKKRGEQVDTGEVIGTAGDTGAINGAGLHFEVRHHGKPVDPLKWLKKGA